MRAPETLRALLGAPDVGAIAVTRGSEPPGVGPVAALIARHALLANERLFTARYGAEALHVSLAERNALLAAGARNGEDARDAAPATDAAGNVVRA